MEKGNYVYSLDLDIHYCDEENEKQSHHSVVLNIGRKTYDECLIIIKALGIKKYCFTKRPKKPNWYQLKYGYETSMVDVCILSVYVGKY